MKSKFYLLFLSVLFFISCSKENIEISNCKVRVENERLIFGSRETFYEFIRDYESKGDSVIRSINLGQSFKSLSELMEKDSSILERFESFNFPQSIKSILNPDGEVVVNDTILWYNNGTIYFIPDNDSKLLFRVKENPKDYNLIGIVRSELIKSSHLKSTILNPNAIDARHQKEFNQWGDSRSRRKYVHEVYCYFQSWPVSCVPHGCYYDVITSVSLRLKLEWKSSSGWKPAGEKRNMYYKVNGSVYFGAEQYKYPINISSMAENHSGDKIITLASTRNIFYGANFYWNINIEGSITHSVVGDISSNKWINSGYPLW